MPTNRTPTTFFGPAYLTTTPATLYTVAAGKIAVVRMINFWGGNSDSGVIAIDGLGGSEDIVYGEAVAQDENSIGWTYLVLTAGQTLDGAANSGNTNLVATITGDLYDA